MSGEQKTLSDFKRDKYTLPKIAKGNSFKNEDGIDVSEINNQKWSVACGQCGAIMRRMGAQNSGWDNQMDGSPDLLDLFSCKACNAGSVNVGYFIDDKEIKMSERGTNGTGHRFVRYDISNLSVKSIEHDDEDDEYIIVSDELDMHGWEEP